MVLYLAEPPKHKLVNLTVSDLMKKPISVSPNIPATRVRRIFRDTATRIVTVTSPDGKLLGVIYRSSIIMLTSAKSEALSRDIAEDPILTLEPTQTIAEAVTKMLKYDEWYTPVLRDNKLAGVLGLESIIDEGVKRYQEKLRELRVDDYMTSEKLITADPDEFIVNVIHRMNTHRYAGLPVVNSHGRLVGIITQYDLIRKGYTRIELESESGPRKGAKVRHAMTYSVFYLYPWSSILEAAETMIKRGIGRIPIVNTVNERRLIGILDREDVVKAILRLEGLRI